jgi:3-hydroxymyristoyl/3-hydroxydecanoyl-(acyl carrier protein) dehydratase
MRSELQRPDAGVGPGPTGNVISGLELPYRFLFVDHITTLEIGRRVEGRYTVPPAVAVLSPCLVAEAIGQLAAWAAMVEHDFCLRPVAALTAAARVHAPAVAGQTLELAVDIESSATDAVAYSGTARTAAAPVVEVSGCVGAMQPMEEFDDSTQLRSQLEVLRGLPRPASGERDPGVETLTFTAAWRISEHVPGRHIRAQLWVPESAPYFADHFPRKPVFPATLLLDAQLRLALELAGTLPRRSPAQPRVREVHDLKLRRFILPGQTIETNAEVRSVTATTAAIDLSAAVGTRVSSAGVSIDLEPR